MPKTAYSVLDLAIVSEGATIQQTLQNTRRLAQSVEAAGYTRYWLAEHHNTDFIGSTAPPILIGHVAEATKTIRVGSGGIMLPNHSPLVVAEQFGTLGQLYPNRIDLGLGRAPGTDQQTAAAIKSDFMQSAHSFPQEIEKLQTYFAAGNKTAAVRVPIAEGLDVPIYILGSSTDSAYLAAAKGLPYAFASHFATQHLEQALKIYKERFQPSEVLAAPYAMAAINVVLADTDEQAQALFTTLIKSFVGILTGKRRGLVAPEPMTPDLEEILQHPAVAQMLKWSFVGSPATVKTQLESFIAKTGVQEIVAVSNLYSIEDRIHSYELFAGIMGEINGVKKEAMQMSAG
jgi:luciferase family oxidoreductase group 1